MDDQLRRLRELLRLQGIPSDDPGTHTLGRATHLLPPSGAQQEADQQRARGRPSGAFRLRGEIGRGGMASVYAAEQVALGREVALKRSIDDSDEARARLLREAMITGQLQHPSIVPVHAVLEDELGPAVVMKRVTGTRWDELIRAGETPLERHLEILLSALNAVEFAHSAGVVHRDIKPENVMLGDFGEVYLLDWGVALRAGDPITDEIVGTPCYMAPEMAEGRADPRTDVFLLGAALHEVLTGAPRHQGETALLLLYAAMFVEPYAYGPEVPEELAAVCNRACARDPAARFQTVAELRQALLTFREHRSASALCEGAEQALGRLRASVAAQAPYVECEAPFLEARLGFDAALRVWPESERAQQGRRRAIELMADEALRERRVDAARALLSLLPSRDVAREEAVAAAAAELTRERARIAQLERDQDPRFGAASRTQSYLLLGLGVGAMTTVLFAQRLLFPRSAPSPLRLTLIGAGVLLLMLLVVLRWQKSGDFNVINRRIAEISVSTLAVSFASRLSGYMLDAPVAHILVGDAFLLGLGGALLAAYHRAGPWLAALSFTTAIVGSIWPDWVDELFIALSIFVPTFMLALKGRALGPLVPSTRPRPGPRETAPSK